MSRLFLIFWIGLLLFFFSAADLAPEQPTRYCVPKSNKCYSLSEMTVLQDNDTTNAIQSGSGFNFSPTSRNISRRLAEGSHDGHGDGQAPPDQVHHHLHQSLIFAVVAIICGCLIRVLMLFDLFSSVQYTVAMYVVGMLCTVVWELNFLPEGLQTSYHIWGDIDAHMILWVFLPPLLLADSITIDCSHFANLFYQILWLAMPGVLLNVAVVGPVLHFLLGTSWAASVAAAAAWSATDPVAVVGLLKELGANPTLTLIIQGEALLNDGSAVIIFNIADNLVKDTYKYEFNTVWASIWVQAVGSVAIGMATAFLTILLIYAIANFFDHHGGMIQTLLTVVCSYATWSVAEDQFGSSGVLAVVTCGICLSKNVWFSLVNKDELLDIWHFIELALNTVVFFLAGVLTMKIAYEVLPKDPVVIGYIFIVYVLLMVVRFAVILISKPILDRIARDGSTVSIPDICVMSWGGLRGAVSLSCGLTLRKHGSNGNMTPKDADRLMVITAGVVFITLVMNSPLSPLIVRKLGLTALTSIQEWMVHQTAGFLENAMETKFDQPPEVVQQLLGIEDVPKMDFLLGIEEPGGASYDRGSDMKLKMLTEVLQDAQVKWPQKMHEYKSFIEPTPETVQKVVEVCVSEAKMCPGVTSHLCTMFLQLVNSEYWRLIGEGHFINSNERTHNPSINHLMNSIGTATATSSDGLGDLAVLFRLLNITEDRSDYVGNMETWPQYCNGDHGRNLDTPPVSRMLLEYFGVPASLIAFVFWSIFEPSVEDVRGFTVPKYWLYVTGAFNLMFILEIVVRHCIAKVSALISLENLFDVLFVCIFTAEFISEFIGFFIGGFDGRRKSFRKLTRWFGVFRLHRLIFIIYDQIQAWRRWRNNVNAETRHTIKTTLAVISILEAYVEGHQYAQRIFTGLFACDEDEKDASKDMRIEAARCLLESYCAVYKAMIFLEYETKRLQETEGCSGVLSRRAASTRALSMLHALEEEVNVGRKTGVLDTKQAFALLRPINHATRNIHEAHSKLLAGDTACQDGEFDLVSHMAAPLIEMVDWRIKCQSPRGSARPSGRGSVILAARGSERLSVRGSLSLPGRGSVIPRFRPSDVVSEASGSARPLLPRMQAERLSTGGGDPAIKDDDLP